MFSLRESEKQFLFKFFTIFFALFILLKAVDSTAPFSYATQPAKLAVAASQEFLLQNIGIETTRLGEFLFHEQHAFQIIIECTGLVLVILLIALLYSTDVKPHGKKRALFIYAPLLLLFNIGRLYATIWTGITFGIPAMDVVHPVLWIVDSGLVLFLWARAAEIKI